MRPLCVKDMIKDITIFNEIMTQLMRNFRSEHNLSSTYSMLIMCIWACNMVHLLQLSYEVKAMMWKSIYCLICST